MLRVVLIVVVTAALLSVSLPVVESGRVTVSETRVQTQLDRIERVARTLVAENDPVPGEMDGARRVLVLHLPESTWGSAGLRKFSLPAGESTVRWRVEDATTHVSVLAAGLVVGPPGGLELGGGRTRLVLELCLRDGEPVVVAHRPSFMTDDERRQVHVRPSTAAGR